MPMYEYRCRKCGHEFAELVRHEREADTQACPSCGAARAERKISTFAAHAAAAPAGLPRAGCGRCGDPNGPCSTN
jgi:putative FmdB family regulatory protein